MPSTTPINESGNPLAFADTRGIRFNITTGGKTWSCTLQHRDSYERTKATRTNSIDSVSTMASTASDKST